jgi:signal transduction histidine kinase
MARSAAGRTPAHDATVSPRLRSRSDDHGNGAWVFSDRLRWAFVIWAVLSLPIVAVFAHFASTPSQYLAVFALLASGLYTTPALINTWLAARRSPTPDDCCWWLWLAALVLMYGVGCAMVVGACTRLRAPTELSALVIATIAVLLMTSIVLMVRARSGGRAMSIDLIESVISVIVVIAPAALLWGEEVLEAEAHWYALPAAIAIPCLVFGVYWAVLLVTRLRGDARPVGALGLTLALFGLVNAVAQTVQGVTGFALPSGPLLVLHALCMSLLSFIPLYVPAAISPGLDRLPPQSQVRAAWIPAALMLAGMPVLVAATLAVRHRYAWAPLYSLLVAAVLVALAALRQLAGMRETRRLYGQVARAAETRRELLAQVMQRNDDDRHRVAAQLHEQAVSAYATFVSFMQTSALVGAGTGAPMAGASALVRDELGKQAESLRQLMLAVQPLAADGRDQRPSRGLSAAIRAYVDSLYGDRRGPCLTVSVDETLVLDWTTEAIVLRIVQEAVSNVRRHSRASEVAVTIRADGAVVEVKVADDGGGFDVGATLFESGIEVMRSCAALADGSLVIDSVPGHGTRIIARLGSEQVEPEDDGAALVVRLRLVEEPAPPVPPVPRLASVDEP